MLLVDVWSLYQESRELRGRTRSDYSNTLFLHCRPLLYVDMRTWNRGAMCALYNTIKAQSLSQANKVKRILTALWNFCAASYPDEPAFQAKCPLGAISETKIFKSVKRRTTRLYKGDLPAFFSGCDALPREDAAWLKLVLFTSLRKESLACARWEWMDWSRGVLRVPGDKLKNHDDLDVVLSAVPLDILRRLHARQRHPKCGEMFPLLNRQCYELVRAQNGIWCRPHDLRRTHASIAAELGYNEFVIKRILGHRVSGSDVTAGYCSFSDDFMRAVNAAVVAKILEMYEEARGAVRVGGNAA